MYSFNFTTKNFTTGERTEHTVTENVYGIKAAWHAANDRMDTVAIDPMP